MTATFHRPLVARTLILGAGFRSYERNAVAARLAALDQRLAPLDGDGLAVEVCVTHRGGSGQEVHLGVRTRDVSVLTNGRHPDLRRALTTACDGMVRELARLDDGDARNTP